MHQSFVFVTEFSSGQMVRIAAVDDSKWLIRRRFKNKHLGECSTASRATKVPVWSGIAARLRFELGEAQDENKPVAYVRVQDWEVNLEENQT